VELTRRRFQLCRGTARLRSKELRRGKLACRVAVFRKRPCRLDTLKGRSSLLRWGDLMEKQYWKVVTKRDYLTEEMVKLHDEI
jgi:hypothetical protein